MVAEGARVPREAEPGAVEQRGVSVGHGLGRAHVDDGEVGLDGGEVRAQPRRRAAWRCRKLRRPGVVQQTVEQRPWRRNGLAVGVLEHLGLELVGGRREQPVDIVARAVERRDLDSLRKRKPRVLIDDGMESGSAP